MKKVKNVALNVIVSSIIGMSFGGCGGGSATAFLPDETVSDSDSDSELVAVGGTFGSDYAFYQPKSWFSFTTRAYAATFGQVEKNIAIPLVNGEVMLAQAYEIPIADDGSFEAILKKQLSDPETNKKEDASWVILIEKTGGDINVLSIPGDNSETLVNLPASKMKSNVFLGQISNTSDEGTSSLNLDNFTQSTEYTPEDLMTLAKADDMTKAIINNYRNNFLKPEDEYINARLTIVVDGNYSIINSDYSKASQFYGYSFNFMGNKKSVLYQNFEHICQTDNALQLVPPSDFTVDGVTYNSANPISSTSGTINTNNTFKSCAGGVFQAQQESENINANFLGGGSVHSITVPTGDWQLKLDGNVIGKYNLSYSLPVQNGQLKLATPAIKLKLDANNHIQGFYLKWYIGDTEISNELVTPLVPEAMIYMQGGAGGSIFYGCMDAMTDSNGVIKSYIDASQCTPGMTDLDYTDPNLAIYLSYGYVGSTVRFTWSYPTFGKCQFLE